MNKLDRVALKTDISMQGIILDVLHEGYVTVLWDAQPIDANGGGMPTRHLVKLNSNDIVQGTDCDH